MCYLYYDLRSLSTTLLFRSSAVVSSTHFKTSTIQFPVLVHQYNKQPLISNDFCHLIFNFCSVSPLLSLLYTVIPAQFCFLFLIVDRISTYMFLSLVCLLQQSTPHIVTPIHTVELQRILKPQQYDG